jgi:hypothetical protein
MQQHVVVTHILADAAFNVAHNKQRVAWPGVASRGNDKEPKWHNVSV